MGVLTIPAPYGGINRTASGLDAKYAVELLNYIPRSGFLEVRGAFTAVNLDTPVAIKTLHEWRGASGTTKLVAQVDDGSPPDGVLYDITTAGVVNSIESPFSSAALARSEMFQNKLILCNGSNTPQVYDGSSATDISVTGVTASTLWGLHTFKGRMYYWKLNDQSFWYAAAGSYQGALTEFPLNTVTSRGGYLMSMVTLQQQGGEGADDLAAFIFSTGEIVIYQGDDPAEARSWQLVGRMQVGEPLSQYATCKVGPTVFLWTTQGIIDLRATLAAGMVMPQTTVSYPINDEMLVVRAPNITQPVMTAYLPDEQLFIALLTGLSADAEFFVYELNSQAWAQWKVNLITTTTVATDPTRCLCVAGGSLYTGGEFAGLMRYDKTVAVDGTYTSLNPGASSYPYIVSYCQQGNVKLQNGKVGLITTASPRTNFDNTSYIKIRVTGDMTASTALPTSDTSSYTPDPTVTTYTPSSTPFTAVTKPNFAVTLAQPSETFSLNMTIAQKHVIGLRWYETRLGWKMGGSR